MPKSPVRLSGIRLHELRVASGLSAFQAAAQIGVAQSTLLTWERGGSTPVVSRLASIANAYGVTIETLLTDQDGATLADYRARAGLLQSEVAAALGVSASAYGAVESGRRAMPPRWRPLLTKLYRAQH